MSRLKSKIFCGQKSIQKNMRRRVYQKCRWWIGLSRAPVSQQHCRQMGWTKPEVSHTWANRVPKQLGSKVYRLPTTTRALESRTPESHSNNSIWGLWMRRGVQPSTSQLLPSIRAVNMIWVKHSSSSDAWAMRSYRSSISHKAKLVWARREKWTGVMRSAKKLDSLR